MKLTKKVMATTFAALIMLACFAPSVAMARTIGDFSFYMTNSNETDQTGVFNATSPVMKPPRHNL